MAVWIASGWWAVAENSLARAWENSLTGFGQFELVGVLRLRNRSAARSSCSAQDDKIFQFRGNTVSATVPWWRMPACACLNRRSFRAAAKTQCPSTPLRFGRDDRVIAGRHCADRLGGIHRRGRDGCARIGCLGPDACPVKGPTLVAKSATRMGHPPPAPPRRSTAPAPCKNRKERGTRHPA